MRATFSAGADPNRAPSIDRLICYISRLEPEAMVENRLKSHAEVSEPRQAIGDDELTNAFVESLEPLLQLANLAYAYSSYTDHVSACRRRALERVGIRAVDLLTELASFVKHET